MATYSQDLRQRVIDCVERKEGSLRQIAQRFVVSLSFVVRLLQPSAAPAGWIPNPLVVDIPPPWGRTIWSDSRSSFASSLMRLSGVRQRLGISSHLMAIYRAWSNCGSSARRSPSRRKAGQPGSPGEAAGVLRGTGWPGPAPAGLCRRKRNQHGDDPDLRPSPGGKAGIRERPGPLGYDHADLRAAVVRGDGDDGLFGCHGHRNV